MEVQFQSDASSQAVDHGLRSVPRRCFGDFWWPLGWSTNAASRLGCAGRKHGAKQIIAIVLGGSAGIAMLAGGLMLAHRRLYDPRIRARSSFADTSILLMLIVQVILGLMTIFVSLGHLDGHEMTKFMHWAAGIFTFDGKAASYIADVNILFKLHIFFGLTIFLVFPFTRLVHMLSAPVRYLWRPGYQIVRTRKGKKS